MPNRKRVIMLRHLESRNDYTANPIQRCNDLTNHALSSFVVDLLLVIRHSSFGGHDTSHPSFPRHRSNRITLLVGRSCRCLRLHRNDDVVWNRAHRHSSNGACAQHFGCVHRHVPVLARRLLLVEPLLAVRAALHSGSVSRWLFAAICFGPENSHRCCAAALRSATTGSP